MVGANSPIVLTLGFGPEHLAGPDVPNLTRRVTDHRPALSR